MNNNKFSYAEKVPERAAFFIDNSKTRRAGFLWEEMYFFSEMVFAFFQEPPINTKENQKSGYS